MAISRAQTLEVTEGRDFYFAIPRPQIVKGETSRGMAPVQLRISSAVKTKVTVSAPGIGYVQQVNVEASITKIIPLNDALWSSAGLVDNGVQIHADAPISASLLISYKRTGETIKLIPEAGLSKKYFTLNLYQDKVGDDFKTGQINIVATRDSTRVTYVPTAATDDVAAGSAKTFTMNKGQVYTIFAKVQPSFTQQKQTDLSGTYIEADKPIAVFTGHSKGAFPRYKSTSLGTSADFMRNLYFESVPPLEMLGTEYITAPIKYNNRPYTAADPDQRGDLIRFVATEDNTIISKMKTDGSGFSPISSTLNKGQFFDITEQESAAYYKSSTPVLVGQYGKAWRSTNVTVASKGGQDNTLNPSRSGAGMLMVIPPINRWSSHASFRSVEEIDNFVMITFKTTDIDSIKFDLQPLRMVFEGISQITGTPYSYARKQIGSGDHSVEGSSPNVRFAVYSYGNYDYTKDGFAYGSMVNMNYSMDCDDKISFKTQSKGCGAYSGMAEFSTLQSCGEITGIYLKSDSSFNYSLTTNFQSPDSKKLSFTLQPITPLQDAGATVIIQTRSGKDTSFTVSFKGSNIVTADSLVDFGLVKLKAIVTKNIKVTNSTNEPITVTSISLKNNKDFSILTTAPFVIPANSFYNIQVKINPLSLGAKEDTVVITTPCSTKEIRIRYKAEKPGFVKEWNPIRD
ncbi:MAG: hypothetical protein V4642_15730 [Bacteroidota bacterium]